MAASLTSDNLKKLGGGGASREEEENKLWEKMQTISELLAKVDGALETATSAPPSTGASQRPPLTSGSQRPTSQRGQSPFIGAPASAMPPGTGGSVRSTTSVRGYIPEAPQLLTVHEDAPPKSASSSAPIELVNYTGTQHELGGVQSRRTNRQARAAQSSIGACLGMDAPR